MNEEKKLILQMLEEGKITSDEAVDLLDALDNSKSKTENKKTEDDFADRVAEFADKSVDFGTKIAKTVLDAVEKIPDFANTAFDSFSEIIPNNYESIISNLEYDFEGLSNPSIDFKGLNGNITVESSSDNIVRIKLICKYKANTIVEGQAFYDFHFSNGTLIFNPLLKKNISYSLKIELPDIDYNSINLNTSNSYIQVNDDIKCNELNLITSNDSIIINDDIIVNKANIRTGNSKINIELLEANIADIISSNGSIVIDVIKGELLNINTSNGKINIDDVEAVDLIVKTSNNSITIDNFNLNKGHFKTSNGNIYLELDDKELPISLDLSTSHGNIQLNKLHPLVYDLNDKNNIVARSENYIEDDNNSSKLIAKTSNGNIKIS